MSKNNETEVMGNEAKKFNKEGIVSLIFSIVGIFVAGLPCGLVAFITGIIGVANFKPDTEKGKWMAITGLVIGVIDIVISAIYIIAVGGGLIEI